MTVPIRMDKGTKDELQFLLYNCLSFFFLTLYIPLVYRTVHRIVQEKQCRVREAMSMMGMNNLSYWASWYTDYTIKNALIVTLCQGILKLWILKKSNFYILWMFFFLYGQSLFGILLISQSAFKNARFGGVMVTLIYFGNSFINNKVNSHSNTRQEALLAGLISPPVFMIQSIQQIIRFESDGNGLDFDHWSIP